jgi:hypothetical protein
MVFYSYINFINHVFHASDEGRHGVSKPRTRDDGGICAETHVNIRTWQRTRSTTLVVIRLPLVHLLAEPALYQA